MESEQVKIGDKTYNVHELLAIDFDSLQLIENKVESMRQLHMKSSDISEEEYNKLTLNERTILTKAINKINGWGKSEEEWNPETGEIEGNKKKNN